MIFNVGQILVTDSSSNITMLVFFCKKKIQQNIKKNSSHGTSLNRNHENSGKQRTACSEENIEWVTNMLDNNPRNISVKRNGMKLTAATFNKITCEELYWHLYKVNVRQLLKEYDF